MPRPRASAAMHQVLRSKSPKHAFALATEAGLTDNLKLVLDPGWGLSYPGGQYVVNPIGGDHFTLGDTGAAESSDPAFNGVPGRETKEEYFSCDGGDWLTVTANPSWVQNLHKDLAKFTLAVWTNPNDLSVQQNMLGTAGATGGGRTGIYFGFVITSGNLFFSCYNTNTQVFSGSSSTNAALLNQWALYMFSFEEGVSRRFSRGSASGYVTSTGTSTYTSPATGNAQSALQYGARGGGVEPMLAGALLGPCWIWEGRALTDTELQALFSATRGRLGV